MSSSLPIEIERKFLLRGDGWRDTVITRSEIRQGYLALMPNSVTRVRTKGTRGFLTIKGVVEDNLLARAEFEYEIPLPDAEHMLKKMCVYSLIEKTRHVVRYRGFTWEIDVFKGANDGLLLAEIELEDTSISPPIPEWIGDEVTRDSRFSNAFLAQRPFSTW
jgi:adenylate cyclase